MTRPIALAGLVALAALGGGAGASAQARVLGPGLEDEVARLVLPGDDRAELAADVRVDGARIEPTHVDVVLAGENRRGVVRMLARGETADGWSAGSTASFDLWLVDGAGDATVRAAARALHARVAARDRGAFFAEHASSIDAGERPRLRPVLETELGWMRGGLWLALVAGLALLAAWARRDGARVERVDLGVALALLVGALALRWLVPPWAPIHANDHAIAEMRGLCGDRGAHEAWLYGSAYLQLVRTCLAPFGRWAEGPLVVASIAGALAAPTLFGLARALAPAHRAGAIVAGLALAIHPTHVRLSLSESPKPLAGTLWLLGTALAVWAFTGAIGRRTRELAFVLCAIAWALALELHVLTMLLPIAGAALVIVAVGNVERGPRWSAIGGTAIVGGVALAHLRELEYGVSAAAERTFDPWETIGRWLGPENVLVDPTLTPWLLLPLVVVATIGLAARGHGRWIAGAAIAVAILGPPSILIDACRTDAIRYQSESHFPLMLLLVGLPFPRPVGLAPRVLVALVPIGLIATAIPGWIDASIPDVHAQAYAIAVDRAPPPPTRILVMPERMRDEPDVLSQLPDYAIADPGRVSTEASPGDCRAWIGVSCWSFTRAELARGARGVELEPGSPMRRECVEMLGDAASARGALAGLVPVEVPHRDAEFHQIVAPAPRVGYTACPPPR